MNRLRHRGRLSILLGCLLPACVALWLYWPSLHFPLMYDTLLHTQLADDVTLRSVWQPSARFGFYRPLVFVPMLVIRDLWGHYPAVLLHALNVAQHTLNVALLSALAWRLWRRWPLTLTVGLLFATFPFAYQALAIYGNNAYLTVTGLILCGLHADLTYQTAAEARAPDRYGWLTLTLLLFITGVLVHELAILLLPLAFLLRLMRIPRATTHPPLVIQIRRGLWPLAPLILVTIIYLGLYFQLSTGGGPQLDYGGNALGPKLLLFLQTAAYPLAWFAHLLPNLSAVTVIITSGCLMLAMIGLALWLDPESWRPLVAGFGWWLLASLLVGLTLPTYYIADGARLLYLGGAGLSFVWGACVTAVWSAAQTQTGRRVALQVSAGVVLLFICFSSGSFVREMLGYYALAGRPIQVMQSVAEGLPPEDGLVMVNLPQWVSPPRNTYALGTEFAPVMGDHLFAYELVNANFGRPRSVYILTEPSLLTETPYHYGIYAATAVDRIPADETDRLHVFITRYTDQTIQTDYTGIVVREILSSTPLEGLANIGDYQVLEMTAERCAAPLNFSLTLKPYFEEAPAETVSLFVQLLGAEGQLLAQADGPPLGLPPGRIEMRPNDYMIDRRQLITGVDPPAQLLVGVYDYVTGGRLEARDQDGNPLPDNALSLALSEVCPAATQ